MLSTMSGVKFVASSSKERLLTCSTRDRTANTWQESGPGSLPCRPYGPRVHLYPLCKSDKTV